MGRYRESGVDSSKNIVRIHPVCREEIEKIQYEKYKGRVAFTQASLELVEQKKELERQNSVYAKKIEELMKNTSRRTKLL